MTLLLAFVYIPPPFSRDVLQLLLSYLANKPDVTVLIMGDFNCYLYPRLDIPPSRGGRGKALSRLLSEVGWMDIWCMCNSDKKQFSCFYKTHGSLSRIDLCVGTPNIFIYTSKVEYFLRSFMDDHPAPHLTTQSSLET